MFERYNKHCSKYVRVPFLGGIADLWVTEDGQVFCKNTQREIKTVKDLRGESLLDIPLWGGETGVRLSLLILLAFGKLKLKPKYFKYVSPFHIDGDLDNFNPGNIGYRFTGWLPSEDFDGYFHIPFFSRYVINLEGILIDLKRKCSVLPYPANGYNFHDLSSDVGWTRIGVYRLKCLAFKPYPDNVDDLTVNHINGIKTDDRLENLEWVTYQENNLHAVRAGLRTQNKHVYAFNTLTGEEVKYMSITDAYRFTGISMGVIIDRMMRSSQEICPGGWIFKSDESTPWRRVTNPKQELSKKALITPCKAKNVFTGEITIHGGLVKAAVELKLPSTHGVINYFLKGRNRPYYGYIFKLQDDTTPWPEFTERQLAIFKEAPYGNSRGVLAIKDGTELFFPHIRKAQQYFRDILKSTNDVIKAISRNRNVNGYKLTYCD